MLDGRLSNEITSIPSSLKDSQRREGVRGGVHNFKGAKGPRGASYMDQHGANEPKGGLLIWTSMCPMNQKGGFWPQFSSLAWTCIFVCSRGGALERLRHL